MKGQNFDTNASGGGNNYLKDNNDALKNEINTEPTSTIVAPANTAPLGKVNMSELKGGSDAKPLDIGFTDFKIETLPSKGQFIPSDTKIRIRPAMLKEIKHYSAMNDEDPDDVSEKLINILELCYDITMGGRKVSIRNVDETDKLYLLFYLRDITMAKEQRQNKLTQDSNCPHCGQLNKIEIVNDIFSYYKIEPKIMRYFDQSECAFIIPVQEANETLKIYIPTIGVANEIRKYIYKQEIKKVRGENGGFYDPKFLTYLQFMVSDYRLIDEKFISEEYRRYTDHMNYDVHEVIRYLAEKINIGIKDNITFKCTNIQCGKDVSSVLRFPRGIANIFNISSAPQRLFED